MSPAGQQVAVVVVEAVLANLEKRRGFKQLMFEIEGDYPAIWAELKLDLVDLVADVLRGAGVDPE